jgi:hypothetical protein
MGLGNRPRVLVAVGFAAVYAAGLLVGAERSASSMAPAATAFLASLNPGQKAQAAFRFTIGEMNEPQRRAVHALLKTGLSRRGYMTASELMELETILGAIETAERQGAGKPQPAGRTPMVRDPLRYFVSIFGTPSASETWGWRVEGHHLSLQFTVVKGSLVAATPTFFGANPAEVKDGPRKGFRLLANVEDAARALVESLDAGQRAVAVIAPEAPNDILTMANVDITPLEANGIAASALNEKQRGLLTGLLDVYAGFMAEDLAAERLARVKAAGLDRIVFAWAGPTARGQKHYYRVQGPTFLIEYDNTQNNGNHIHSVWRDFNGDFGRDLLREHLRSAAH